MNRITLDLVTGMKGPDVANLQDGLRLLLEQSILDLPQDEQSVLLKRLRTERQASKYGTITAKIVSVFQERNGLAATGEVHEDAAAAMNEVLARLGAFDAQPARTREYVVAGSVTDQAGKPCPGLQVAAYHSDEEGPIRLGTDRSDAVGRYTIRFDELAAVPEIVLAVEAADEQGRIVARSERQPLVSLVARVDLSADRPVAPVEQCRVDGRIVLDNGAPAASLGIRVYRLEFGGGAALLREGATTTAGDYALAFDATGRTVTLEVRAMVPGGEEVTLSKPLTMPAGEQVLRADLVAPADMQPAEAEYTRLTTALAPVVGELKQLAGTREDARQRDLTELNAVTGWDARPIALAATAQRLEQDPEVKLRAEALYGLFRAGLPRDKHMLAQLDPEDVGVALKNLADNGIIAMDPDDITEFTRAFGEFAREVRLAVPAPGAQTTYAEMLKSARVDGAAAAFADVYLRHRGDPARLWQAAREAHIPDEVIGKLQWQGKLAFLAGNSGKVTEYLMSKLEGGPLAPGEPAELKSPVELVSHDLYDAETWETEIRGLAAGDEELAALIPAAYEGKTVDDRLNLYAADMARKVRISYPTEVVTRMVETDKIKLNGAKDVTVKLLQAARLQGFAMGRTPVEQFVSAGMALPQDMEQADVDLAKQEIKRLYRVYQITPGNESMPVLRELGLESAFDVTALGENAFYRLFHSKYFELYRKEPSEPEKRLVWRKAQQVSSMTYTIFGVAKKVDTDLAVPAVSGTQQRHEEDRKGLTEALKGYPTMEELFGPMDFCECDHCRSVLSPAAYLVDLLQFVEAEPLARGNFLAGWQERNGRSYGDMGFLDPYEALTKRRPDLPHIPLTCENTNVALPYIDVVNEILEYYVANDGLAKDAAHDTGDATSAELLAEPQNVIAEAYRQLLGEEYPLTLPFDLWLETVREFCMYAETPLYRMLETFRTSEDFLPAAPAHGWAGIFTESLGISPAERAIFADSDPLAAWWKLYGYDTKEQATVEALQNGQRVDLNSARALSRRLGVTYKELVQLVTTKFVNPDLAKLGVLHKLSAGVADLKTFLTPENQTFLNDNKDLLGENLSPEQQARAKALTKEEWELLTDLGGFADRVQAYADGYQEPVAGVMADLVELSLDDVIVLADPDADCSFDKTILRYADGDPAGGDVFLRLNLFVRLWRRLGWNIEEVDQALTAFVPADEPFAEGHFDKKPLETALVYLAHLKTLDEKLKVGQPSRARLLTLWTDIPTEGENSLYSQLFLTHSVLKADKIFDHPQGDYLAADWVAKQGQDKPPDFILLKGHLPAIQSALGLTADEVTEILADAKEPIATAKLTITNLSALHRYGLLAKALRVSIHELITLKALSGKHPFTPLEKTPLTALEKDHPHVETLEFVKVAEKVKKSGFTIEDLDFLLRRRFDEAGPRRQDRPATLTLLATLANEVRTIRREHAMPADTQAITEEFLQQKLGLLLSPLNVETVLRMVRGEEDVDAASTRAFFDNVLRQQQVRQAGEAGFLDAEDYPALFQPLKPLRDIEPGDTPEQVEAKQAENETILAENHAELLYRRNRLAAAVLPVLQNRLIRQLAVQTLAAETDTEPALVERLITDAGLLSVEVSGVAKQPLVNAFTAAADEGIEADFYVSATGDAPRQDSPKRLASADTALRPARNAGGQALPPANSARFNGFLVTRATGPYRFLLDLEKPGAQARLTFAHLANPLFLDKTAESANAEFGIEAEEFVELQAAVPYRFSFELDALNEGAGRLTVQGETTPRGPLSQLTLYPATGLEAAEAAYTLLRAALELLAGLGLTLRDTVHIAGHPANWDGVNLSDLPAQRTGETDLEKAATTDRFGWFLRLAEYADLKRELAGGTDALIDVFEANGTDAADRLANVYERFGKLARREPAVVQDTAETLFAAAERDFADDRRLLRLWDALKLVERFGAPAAAIRGWTKIAAPNPRPTAPENDARFAIAREVKETVKARFDPQNWQRVAQPIFDRLRKRQRDALAAAVMHRQELSSPEELFEYFLIDPGMEPVVRTSRIRMAIGSVRLFIQRCLLNLEEQVHPSAILNADQWDHMKHSWETNRKIFLFPENWLEPEFRDDKTHLFKELESALMENDVSADVAEEAFSAYLNKLAALAKLEIVAMHLESKPDFAKNTLHVFGRTHSTPHKYFYRRYTNRMWTPWEPVGVDIQGDHLAPVVWRDRLYLFWVTFMESGRVDGAGPANADDLASLPVTKHDVEAHLHWSEYVAGEWQAPESGGYQAPKELRVRAEELDSFDLQSVFVHVTVVEAPDIGAENAANLQDAGVYISLGDPINKAFHLPSRHSAPVSRGAQAAPPVPFGVDTTEARRRPTSYAGAGDKLTVSFRQRVITGPGEAGADVKPESLTILDTTGPFTLLPVNNRTTLGVSTEAIGGAVGEEQEQNEVKKALEATIGEIESLIKPVFFQDAHQVLFVEPEVTERTIQQWEEWVTRTPVAEPEAPAWHLDPRFWEKYVKPLHPVPEVLDPTGPRVASPFSKSLIQPKSGIDWLVNPGTGLLFDGQIIGSRGLAPVDVIPATDVPAMTAQGAATVTVNAGSGIAADAAVVLPGGNMAVKTGLTRLSQGLNIVGDAGFNAALRQNVDSFTAEGLSGPAGPMGSIR